MKKKFFPALLVALGFTSFATSCNKAEVCYRCSISYTYYGQSYSYSYTLCEEDFNTSYYSGYSFEQYVDYLKSSGYTCEKKKLK